MYCLRDNYVTNADTNVKGRLVFSAITRGFFCGAVFARSWRNYFELWLILLPQQQFFCLFNPLNANVALV